MKIRRNRPMFFIDIAVPRDIDPAVNDLDGIFVYDIDDLQQVVASNLSDRYQEARRAEELIQDEVRRFTARLQTLDVVPTIVSLQEHLETIRQAEIDRQRGRLGAISPEQEMAIEALSRGIINKIMHTPITHLKSAARDQQNTQVVEVVDVVRRLFNLRDTKAQSTACGESPATSPQRAGTGLVGGPTSPQRANTGLVGDPAAAEAPAPDGEEKP
jgi:glutamyl-tRNA reductase